MTATRDLLNQLFPESYDQRALFARQLARLAEECGQDQYGQRLREMFAVEDVYETQPNIADETPPGLGDGEPPEIDDRESTGA